MALPHGPRSDPRIPPTRHDALDRSLHPPDSAIYKIRVENPSSVNHGVALMNIDGKLVPGRIDIAVTDDGAVHEILVVMG
jgi:hypothetical protein